MLCWALSLVHQTSRVASSGSSYDRCGSLMSVCLHASVFTPCFCSLPSRAARQPRSNRVLLWTETALKKPHLSKRYTFVLPDTVRDRCSSGGQGLATFCLHSGT